MQIGMLRVVPGVSAPVDLDGTSAVRPTARGQCPDNVPIRVTSRAAGLRASGFALVDAS